MRFRISDHDIKVEVNKILSTRHTPKERPNEIIPLFVAQYTGIEKSGSNPETEAVQAMVPPLPPFVLLIASIAVNIVCSVPIC